MTAPEFLGHIDRFQTMIVGIVGFLGVIWTLSANARYARLEHSRQLRMRRAVLRRILAAEFRNYSDALKRNRDAIHSKAEEVSVGKIRRLLSEGLTADLGLLDPDEIDIVVNALISLDGFEHCLESICQNNLGTRFIIPAEALPAFRNVCDSTATALDLAVEAMEMSNDR
ncbi:hypothetical protein [Actibacterium sp. XHP0104]|uniref:hypothetical protein n=1 Tax=Actibacterium sp. XHP0104 TaxID=2984335 RepID=UPI0021E7F588|nr:hypothetical protein [Actibacterium sp. XHP0104]MCV2883064.1 hypothetical protein [Actibacterium sp. XHP0104]